MRASGGDLGHLQEVLLVPGRGRAVSHRGLSWSWGGEGDEMEAPCSPDPELLLELRAERAEGALQMRRCLSVSRVPATPDDLRRPFDRTRA